MAKPNSCRKRFEHLEKSSAVAEGHQAKIERPQPEFRASRLHIIMWVGSRFLLQQRPARNIPFCYRDNKTIGRLAWGIAWYAWCDCDMMLIRTRLLQMACVGFVAVIVVASRDTGIHQLTTEPRVMD